MLPTTVEPVPIQTDEHGVVRVAGTRVTLDTVIAAFETGATAEGIAEDYPLRLDDVYAVILYFLRHRDEVRAYLAERRERSDEIRRANRSAVDQTGLRERLLARGRAGASGSS
jgi:uncharacterized protein (DUF433 family)